MDPLHSDRILYKNFTEAVISTVKDTPNDMSLGKKVRELVKDWEDNRERKILISKYQG